MNLTLLRVGVKGRIQASASLISIPWSPTIGNTPQGLQGGGQGGWGLSWFSWTVLVGGGLPALTRACGIASWLSVVLCVPFRPFA